jgi:hypothetical protein
MVDNESAISMMDPPSNVFRLVKHINISYHWIHEAVKAQIINPVHVPTEDNILDIFTKPLTIARHQKLTKLLGFIDQSVAC